MDTLINTTTRQELRDWLTLHAATAKEAWVPCAIKPAPGKIAYLDVVEEALCFGWIDSTKMGTGDAHIQRISPRSKKSHWTELNKERVRRLEKLGLMTEQGRACLPDMSPESFTVLPQVLAALQADPQVWECFLALPELYRRVRIDNIQWCIKTKQPDLFESRLQKFADSTRQGRMYGSWNDDGRLLDY